MLKQLRSISNKMSYIDESIIESLKKHLCISKTKHNALIMQEKTLKNAHIYCVINNISAQQFGPLLEFYICQKYSYNKNYAKHCKGDCSKNGKNSEIKVSLGGNTHTNFNYVQLRPSHDYDTYILTAYHLCESNVEHGGELYVFKLPKDAMKNIILAYGGYAHGTIKEHGKITIDSLHDTSNKLEYALRPVFNDNCWKALLSFRIDESDI